MKVGIITERLNQQKTGVDNAIYNLISELSKQTGIDIYLISSQKNNDLFPELKNISIHDPFKRILKKTSTYSWYLFINYYLSKKNLDLDIIHNPDNSSLFINLKNKKIVTIYDIMAFKFPKVSDPVTRFRYRILLYKTLKSSDKIITISNHTKLDLMNYFKIPEDKIKVIYLAANQTYKKLGKNEINEILKKYDLNNPFILYVGGLAPNKNIERLLESYNIIKNKEISQKLILTGVKRHNSTSALKTIKKLNLQNDVIFTGYVPDEDLPGLYNAADLFVYPSLYEGFGLPPLEAMQCGTPVITSNTSSLPEVVGDAGIMINPYDVDELANKMYEVLTNEKLRKEMSKKGLERAKLFSWKKCAEEHLKVYEEVLGR
ncbi:glycosyl transferase group 1 [Methanococcus maripaludis X1]|uniref:Glycosyl transferase group 1 n=1 Tax=Methanococcus maripaludis X1 TaxID=1053692 RepID=G0H2R7_METMI|nr:glycosyltransferase family 1 protein [Methanococcus maripaludis]AEK19266.1 glycosyl transferase group 1 [Methanococcus maripaludis X1]